MNEFEGQAFRVNAIGEEQCDFCGCLLRTAPEVWTHFSKPGEYATSLEPDGHIADVIPNLVVTRPMSNPDQPTTLHLMDLDGLWAACRDCHLDVCNDNRDALVTRAARVAVDGILREHRGLKARQVERMRAEIRVRARQAHEGFFLHEDRSKPPVLEVAYTLTGWPYRAGCPHCGRTLRLLHSHSTYRKAAYECDACHRAVEATREG